MSKMTVLFGVFLRVSWIFYLLVGGIACSQESVPRSGNPRYYESWPNYFKAWPYPTVSKRHPGLYAHRKTAEFGQSASAAAEPQCHVARMASSSNA
ncbi:hypothetical protein UPYG_G00064680 [Umbra pygmaea]|uniref:Secreted protein n=1 Tax=Umbra pygmaea TaxID=75934 RepID=A0ABD0XQ04_UMBPY